MPGLLVHLCGQIFQVDKFSHVEIEFIRLEICTIYTTISNAYLYTLSQFKRSLSSNTLSKFKHSHSNTEISHPQPLGVQQKSPLPSNALLFPHNRLQTIPSPIPWKSLLSLPTEVQILSSLKVCFLIKIWAF